MIDPNEENQAQSADNEGFPFRVHPLSSKDDHFGDEFGHYLPPLRLIGRLFKIYPMSLPGFRLV